MKKFENKIEEFNYYVYKSEWYKQHGNEAARIACLKKAEILMKEIDEEEREKGKR